MKKKLLLTGILFCTMFCFTACGETSQSQVKEETVAATEAEGQADGKETEETEEKIEIEGQEINSDTTAGAGDESKEQKVLIYFGNENADGIIYKEVTINELSPEELIKELGKVNIVSLDTKVKSVYVDEKDKKLLHLDMSKEFGEYISMMGTAGEYIVLGGLVDTFLDAYDCEKVKVTVEGKTLETGHATYEGELQFFEVHKTEQ